MPSGAPRPHRPNITGNTGAGIPFRCDGPTSLPPSGTRTSKRHEGGPQGAFIAECFTPRLRYSGFSLGFHFASITAGGPAPLIATALLAWTGSGYVIALYILLSAAVTFASAIFLPDLTNRDISQEVA